MGSLRGLKSQNKHKPTLQNRIEKALKILKAPVTYFSMRSRYEHRIITDAFKVTISIKEDRRSLIEKIISERKRYRLQMKVEKNKSTHNHEDLIYESTSWSHDKSQIELVMDDARMILSHKPENWRSEYSFPQIWVLEYDSGNFIDTEFKTLLAGP
jgi:hypothetical protein